MLGGLRVFRLGVAVVCILGPAAAMAQQGPAVDGITQVLNQSLLGNNDTTANDYVKATPLPLPLAKGVTYQDIEKAMQPTSVMSADTSMFLIPGVSLGAVGSGEKQQSMLGDPAPAKASPGGLITLDFGTSNLPFSTARADLDPVQTNDQFPYRAAGKLFFLIDSKSYICSASLIKTGIVVTAGHCVAAFGKKTYYSGWEFVPGFRQGVAPFGVWTAATAAVLTSYSDGSDACQQAGVVCQDDVAVIVLNPKKKADGTSFYPGQSTGWFSYAWDRSGFASQSITHITQIGYPACLDNGGFMERNDAQGATDPAHSSNTIIGSLMCGGSSGGPWLINFGIRPTLTDTTLGSAPAANAVVGVTSWGSTSNAVKWMGASPFLSTNIVPLVDAACKAYPDACKS